MTRYEGARLIHGEGVAIGMACAFRFSRDLGLCAGQDAVRVEKHLRGVGLPTRIAEIPGLEADAPAILNAMRQDKKVERGRLAFILAKGIGESFVAKDVLRGRGAGLSRTRDGARVAARANGPTWAPWLKAREMTT